MLDPNLRQRHSDAQGKAGFNTAERGPLSGGVKSTVPTSGGVLKRNISRNAEGALIGRKPRLGLTSPPHSLPLFTQSGMLVFYLCFSLPLSSSLHLYCLCWGSHPHQLLAGQHGASCQLSLPQSLLVLIYSLCHQPNTQASTCHCAAQRPSVLTQA